MTIGSEDTFVPDEKGWFGDFATKEIIKISATFFGTNFDHKRLIDFDKVFWGIPDHPVYSRH
jgi:hypothetical protein